MAAPRTGVYEGAQRGDSSPGAQPHQRGRSLRLMNGYRLGLPPLGPPRRPSKAATAQPNARASARRASKASRPQPPFRPPRPTLSGSSRKTRRTHPRSIPNGPNQGTSAQRKRTGAAERQGAEPAAPRQDSGGQTRWAPNDSLYVPSKLP